MLIKGRAPELTVIEDNNILQLSWEDTNSSSTQIWRKIAGFDDGNCFESIEYETGYILIDEIDAEIGQFEQNLPNLPAGAKICYRLVSHYPGGGQSAMSEEICVVNNLNNPVLTRVSTIDQGVELVWEFDNDEVSKYQIYRSSNNSEFQFLTETESETYLDTDVAIPSSYSYKIQARNNSDELLGESVASGNVILDVISNDDGKVCLNWGGDTSWSLFDVDNKEHIIYRGTSADELEPLDSIDVFGEGLRYIDQTNLTNGNTYCYRILTKGTYGNGSQDISNFTNTVCIDYVLTNAKELQLNNLLVYPNPISKTIHFTKPLLDASLTIYNLKGAQELTINQFNGQQLDVSDLKPQNYIMVIQLNGHFYTYRLIKK